MIERYTREAMGKIWSEENKFKTWLDVELAVCEAHADLDNIPKESITSIRKKASFNIDRIKELDKEVHHETIAFLTCVAESIDNFNEEFGYKNTDEETKDSRFLHLGMTSSDLLDTALSLQIREASQLIEEALLTLIEVLKDRALEHKDTICMGRSHGVHAEPTTFGLKLLGYYDELNRSLASFRQAVKENRVGMISGAVGTYANVGPDVEEIACKKLKLKPAGVTTQIIGRDRHAKLLSAMAVIAGSVERIATEVRHLQRTEVLEVEEPFVQGQKGSSAMPHKRNPWRSENISGLSRLVRSYSQVALENIVLWHERDMSHSSTERVILPDSFCVLDFMLQRMAWIIKDLNVYPKNMERNLNRFGGVSFSQQVLLKLIDAGLKREDAYTLVQKLAHSAWNRYDKEGNEINFKNLVLESEEVAQYLSKKDIDETFDPSYHLKNIDEIFNRIA